MNAFNNKKHNKKQSLKIINKNTCNIEVAMKQLAYLEITLLFKARKKCLPLKTLGNIVLLHERQ